MWSYLDRENTACVVEDVDAARVAEGDHIAIHVKLISLLLFVRADDAFERFELMRCTVRDKGEEKGFLVNHLCFQFYYQIPLANKKPALGAKEAKHLTRVFLLSKVALYPAGSASCRPESSGGPIRTSRRRTY